MSDSFINDSVISTPQPRASSTLTKKDPIRKIDRNFAPIQMNYSVDEEQPTPNSMGISKSLGILNMDEIDVSMDLKDNSDITDLLKQQRQLAQSTLDRANKVGGLPSKYLKPDCLLQKTKTILYAENSTVNESDLLRGETSVHSQSFNPNNVSTPRTSEVAEKLLENNKSICDNISEMSEKIRNSEISFQDLCLELSRSSIGKTSIPGKMSIPGKISIPANPEVDSMVFTPAELMSEKFKKDEMSWRREKDIPVESFRSNITNASAYQEKDSMGDFFKCRSNEIGDIFSAGDSPEKKVGPIPLVDVTNTMDNIDESQITNATIPSDPDYSLVSVSQIAKALSDFSSDTPSKILDYLSKNKKKNRYEENSKLSLLSTKENDCDDYVKAQEVERFSRSTCRHSTSSRPKSKSPIQRTPAIRKSSCYGRKSPLLRESLETKATNHKSPSGNDSFEFLVPNASSSSRFSTGKKSSDSYDSSKSGSSTIKDKENTQDRSLSSVRCPSSLDSLPEGKLPIKGNRTELIWGCIKLGKRSVQDFCIRNQLNQKIRMQVSVSGSYFRIVRNRDDTEMLTSMIFMLHAFETKSMSVMFCPATVGTASEKLVFTPMSKGEVIPGMKQTLMLFGYGGHATLDISKVAKDAHSKLWLSLGTLDHKPVIRQEFTVKNNGILPAFASMTVTSDGISNVTNLKIQPSEFVLKPQEEVAIFITYITSKQDYRFNQDILDVGCIKLISGPEVIRGRLRRLCRILEKKQETIDPVVLRLSKQFAEENMPPDLKLFKESVAATKDLLSGLCFKEIRVTIEKDPDLTIVPNGEFEDTSLYQTLCQDSSVISAADVTAQSLKGSAFRVEPSNILLSVPIKQEDMIVLHSDYDRVMPFEVAVQPDCFEVTPSIGSIGPGEMLALMVRCTQVPAIGRGSGKVSIYVENEVMEVNVKTILIRGKK